MDQLFLMRDVIDTILGVFWALIRIKKIIGRLCSKRLLQSCLNGIGYYLSYTIEAVLIANNMTAYMLWHRLNVLEPPDDSLIIFIGNW